MTSAAPANPPTTTTGPLMLDDVRAALGDTDPRTTNAGALRGRLGRGSVSTIQKHLDKLRADLVIAPTTDNSTPAVPAEAIAALWSAAWSAAQAQTLGRLNLVTQERDAARERVALLSADLDAATVELDKTADELAGAQAAAQSALQAEQAKAAEQQAAATATAERLAAELAAARVEIERVTAAAAHAAQLAQRDAELKDAAHARIVAHLTDQVAELKSALHRTPPTV